MENIGENYKTMDQKMKKIWLEVGLAIALVVSLSFLGAKMGSEHRKKETKLELAEAENKTAAEHQDGSTDHGAAGDLEAGTGASDPGTASAPEAEEVIADGQYPIMGKSSVTVEQMVSYFNSANYPFPAEQLSRGGADSIETFCRMYYEEASAEGVRPEVAFVQTMKETGWLQYPGDTSVEQFNFAGLGATGGGAAGNSYPDVRTGIRAQVQHLKAYATADALAQECVDDRYEYVMKGCAPYVEWLGQKENPGGQGWATDENYGYFIVEMIHSMEQMK